MSAGNVTSFSEAAARRGRKSVSFHDKLEEARERRAQALSRQPIQVAAGAAQAAARPQTVRARPVAIDEPDDAAAFATPELPPALPNADPSIPPAARAEAASGGRRLAWTIRVLALLLVVLTGIAAKDIAALPPLPSPDFAPPQVRLPSQAFGPPLLATVSRGADRSLRSVERRALAGALPPKPPAPGTAAPAPRGPAVMPIIQPPAAPSAEPALLVVLPNDARPPMRPRPAADAQN